MTLKNTMISLIVEPKTPPMEWESFRTQHSNSIALDGYVIGPAKWCPITKCANFNHHENVDRLSTRATCAQVLMALRQGLLDNFKNFSIYVNDCDQDVCLSTFILLNGWRCESVANPLLNKLVHVADMMDTCAGCYPFPVDMSFMAQMAWIFEPYTIFRNNGLDKKDSKSYRSVIDDVLHRINDYLVGGAGEIELDTRYEILSASKKWSLVNEIGQQARMSMISDGIKAYVSCRNRSDGKWSYSIGKISNFIDFDIEKLFEIFNKIENLVSTKDKWGGSSLIGGSSRIAGSNLSPEIITKIINDHVGV